MSDTAKLDITEILAAATLVERTVPICVDGKLGEHLAQLQEAYREACKRDLEVNGPTVAGPGEAVAGIAAQIALLEAEADSKTYDFLCRALPTREWKALAAKYPAPPDDDTGLMWDPEMFPYMATRACVVDPVMDEAQFDQLVDTLSDAQWRKLWLTVAGVNMGDDLIPKSGLGIDSTDDSEPTSTTPPPEE